VALAGVLALPACGDGDGSKTATATVPNGTVAASPPPPPAPKRVSIRAEKLAVARTIDRANATLVRGEYRKTCSYYTKSASRKVRTTVEADTCEEAFRRVAQMLRSTLSAEQLEAASTYGVARIRIDDGHAFARFGTVPRSLRGVPGFEANRRVELAKVRGGWKISSLPQRPRATSAASSPSEPSSESSGRRPAAPGAA